MSENKFDKLLNEPKPKPLKAVEETLSEEQEQTIRDHFGYTATEKRTKAERDAAAKRMLDPPEDVIP